MGWPHSQVQERSSAASVFEAMESVEREGRAGAAGVSGPDIDSLRNSNRNISTVTVTCFF